MNIHDLSALERQSIRDFLEYAASEGHFKGEVLDYGCGKRPYGDLVARSAMYHPYDRAQFGGGSGGNVGPNNPLGMQWDAILCTQVVEYVPDVYRLLRDFREALNPGGALVLTGPTTWPEIRDDLHRHTRLGIERLLKAAGFSRVAVQPRAALPFDGFELSLGYGAIGQQ